MSFRNGQAWLSIVGEDGVYLGTLHVTCPELVDRLKRQRGELRLLFENASV